MSIPTPLLPQSNRPLASGYEGTPKTNEHDLGWRDRYLTVPLPQSSELILPCFGAHGANRYDLDASVAPERYRIAQSVRNNLAMRLLGTLPTNRIVVDLGCGTGTDGIDILYKAHDSAFVGLDSSPYMLDRARAKLQEANLSSRSIVFECNICAVASEQIREKLDKFDSHNYAGLVISAFTFHHFNPKEKANAFRLAYELVVAGGFLLLTDLYSSMVTECAEQALQMELSDIRDCQRQYECRYGPSIHPTTLSVEHYVEENHPTVLGDDIRQLAQVGFQDIDVVFKYGQVTIVVARK